MERERESEREIDNVFRKKDAEERTTGSRSRCAVGKGQAVGLKNRMCY